MRTFLRVLIALPVAVIGYLYFALSRYIDVLPGGLVAGLIFGGLVVLGWRLSGKVIRDRSQPPPS